MGRHIHTSAGLALGLIVGLYLYGIHCNRVSEMNSCHLLYDLQSFDKRNRLLHNLVMEHFEVHKESLEELILDLNAVGPKVFVDLPQSNTKALDPVTLDDFALIDELSGLTLYLDNFMKTHNVPETVKDRLRARMVRYSGEKPIEIARNEMRMKLYGVNR